MANVVEARSAADSECWPELHEEVARLPEKYREPVVLCYLEGLTTDEASRRLGCPQGTILSRLSRARDRLRDRLTRRGLAVPAGLLSADAARAAAVPAALSHSVIQSALRLAAGDATATVIPASVAGLTRGVIRTMIVTKLGITAAALTAVAALAAGAGALLPSGTGARTQAPSVPAETRAAPSRLVADIGKIRALLAPELIPNDLKWTDVAPDQRLQTLDYIAGQTRINFEQIRTWKGTYAYKAGQLLSGNQVPPVFKNGLPMQNVGALLQEFDCRMDFAIDMASGNVYRDKRTSAMNFVNPGTKEVVDIPNAGAFDSRSIVTKEQYIYFDPYERATYGYLQHLPEAHNKRMARRSDLRRAMNSHFGDMMDPRLFFTFDTGNKSWLHLELIAGALSGKNGDKTRRMVEERFSLAQADGPGGRWYCHQQWFDMGKGPTLWSTAFWSPRAGFNPVGYVTTFDKPDGKVSTKVEWEWTVIDGIYVPSRIKEIVCEVPGGNPSRERESKLENCVLNQPLDPHQFDHAGLGMADGDLIIDEQKRVGYIIKDGEPVKLGDFVDPRRR